MVREGMDQGRLAASVRERGGYPYHYRRKERDGKVQKDSIFATSFFRAPFKVGVQRNTMTEARQRGFIANKKK